MKPLKVLIVDDNVVQADALAEYLSMRGHEADWAPCLVGALGRMKLKRYDVAVLDLVLPCCSAGDLVEGILGRPVHPRIVALTGLSPGDPTLETLPPGTPVLHKPADPDEIMETLERVASTGGAVATTT